MQWSKMSSQQRAWLTARATWRPVIVLGKLVKHEPFNVYAQTIVAAKTLDRDANDRRAKILRTPETAALVTKFIADGYARKMPDGKARNAGYLNRVKGGALPMQYFRSGGTA